MIYNLLHKRFTKKIASISIYISDLGIELYSVLVSKEKDKIEILSTKKYTSVEDFLKETNTNIPYILNFHGNSIIEKKVPNEDGYLNKILFNKDSTEFYISEYGKKNIKRVCIAKRELINNYLTIFKTNKLSVIDFSIGSSVLLLLENLLSSATTIKTKYYSFNFESLDSTKNKEGNASEEINISGDYLNNEYLEAFSNIINYVTKQSNTSNYKEKTERYESEYVYHKSTKAVLFTGIITTLTLLLASYFIKDIYFKKNINIENDLQKHNTLVQKKESLKKDLQYKNKVISQNSLKNNYYLSEFITGILNEVPSDIDVLSFNLFPLVENTTSNEKWVFKTGIVKIEVLVKSQNELDKWIDQINKKKWVQKIEIETLLFKNNTLNTTINIEVK